MATLQEPLPRRHVRLDIALRTVAGIGGGYVLAALVTRTLALTLPLRPVDAVVAATLAGLAVYPCAIMWSFAARTPTRVWLGTGAACAVATLALLVARALAGAP